MRGCCAISSTRCHNFSSANSMLSSNPAGGGVTKARIPDGCGAISATPRMIRRYWPLTPPPCRCCRCTPHRPPGIVTAVSSCDICRRISRVLAASPGGSQSQGAQDRAGEDDPQPAQRSVARHRLGQRLGEFVNQIAQDRSVSSSKKVMITRERVTRRLLVWCATILANISVLANDAARPAVGVVKAQVLANAIA